MKNNAIRKKAIEFADAIVAEFRRVDAAAVEQDAESEERIDEISRHLVSLEDRTTKAGPSKGGRAKWRRR